jgi:hypothetical protein
MLACLQVARSHVYEVGPYLELGKLQQAPKTAQVPMSYKKFAMVPVLGESSKLFLF